MKRERQLLLFIHLLFAGSHQFSTTSVRFSWPPSLREEPNGCPVILALNRNSDWFAQTDFLCAEMPGQASGTFLQEIEGMDYGFVLTIWTGSLVAGVRNYRLWHDSERVARMLAS